MVSGKIILFGEHAVVYNKAGIAVPVDEVSTHVTIKQANKFGYNSSHKLSHYEKTKLEFLFNVIFENLNVERNVNIDINSTIPLGSGLGSSASLSVALIRALCLHYNLHLSDEEINNIAFECEKIFHGRPSGIDNTVITYGKPVFFHKNKIEIINLKKPIYLVIADTGIKSDTKEVVEEVRRDYLKNKEKFDMILNEIEQITINAKQMLEKGDLAQLGKLMHSNHLLLKDLGVSCTKLNDFVLRASNAGAYGAKMVGAGKGGNIAALTDKDNREIIAKELMKIAKNVIITEVK